MRLAAIGLLFVVIGSNTADASCVRTCGCDAPSEWVVAS